MRTTLKAISFLVLLKKFLLKVILFVKELLGNELFSNVPGLNSVFSTEQ